MFIQRYMISPALGKGREVRVHVEEHIKERQQQGMEISLATSVFGDVPSLSVTIRFNDLAAFEKHRAKNAADKDYQQYSGKLNSMATIKAELLEVIVPFPKS
jgi:NIPSNAP